MQSPDLIQERHKNADTSSRAPKNSNGESACQIKLNGFSERLGTYRELTLAFSSTGTKSPKTPMSNIAASSEIFGFRRNRCTECNSLW